MLCLWLSSIGVMQGKFENLMDFKLEIKKVNGENWFVWEIECVSDKEIDCYWVLCIYGYEQIWLV